MKLGISLQNVKAEDNHYSPVPAGNYTAVISDIEMKQSKRNASSYYLNIVYKIIKGDFANRIISDIVNVKNDNAMAVEIGLGRLKRMCDIHNINSSDLDTDLLKNKTFDIYLKIEKNAEFGDKNKITSINACDININNNAPKDATEAAQQNSWL